MMLAPFTLAPLALVPAAAPPPIVIIRLCRRYGCEADYGNRRSCECQAAGGSPSRNPRLWMCHRISFKKLPLVQIQRANGGNHPVTFRSFRARFVAERIWICALKKAPPVTARLVAVVA